MNDFEASLIDIVEPVVPSVVAQNTSATWTIIAAAAVVLAALLWRRVKSAKRRRTVRQLRRLEKLFQTGHLTQRELAYRLATQLQNYFAVPRLRTGTPPLPVGIPHQVSWRDFMHKLDALRYRPGYELEPMAARRLLADAQRWLH